MRVSCAEILLRLARSDCALVVAGWRCGWGPIKRSEIPRNELILDKIDFHVQGRYFSPQEVTVLWLWQAGGVGGGP
jgi:hypothetical protein